MAEKKTGVIVIERSRLSKSAEISVTNLPELVRARDYIESLATLLNMAVTITFLPLIPIM